MVCLLYLYLLHPVLSQVSVLQVMEIYEDYDPVPSHSPPDLNSLNIDIPTPEYEPVVYVKTLSTEAKTDLERKKHRSMIGKTGFEWPSIWVKTVEQADVVAAIVQDRDKAM